MFFLRYISTFIPFVFVILLLAPMVAFGQSGVLENPLAVPSLNDLLEALLNIATILATPIIVFLTVYAGFLYVSAQGNPEKLEQARRALMYAVIGAVIVFGAQAILTIVEGTVEQFEN